MDSTFDLSETVSTLPQELVEALATFSQQRPDWPQQRVFTAALSLFLMQMGGCDRVINRIYLDAQFGKKEP